MQDAVGLTSKTRVSMRGVFVTLVFGPTVILPLHTTASNGSEVLILSQFEVDNPSLNVSSLLTIGSVTTTFVAVVELKL